MGRSPEQIAGRLKLEQGKPVISHESIYRFVHGKEGRKEKLHRYLPQAKAKRGRRTRRGNKSLIPNRISIHDRPAVIGDRREFGHWEGYLMAFSRPGQNNVVLTERKSRYILAARQPDKTAATTTASLNGQLYDLPEQAKRSITFDNGGEFVGYASLGLKTYFATRTALGKRVASRTLSAGSDAISRAPQCQQIIRGPTSATSSMRTTTHQENVSASELRRGHPLRN